MIRIMAKQLMKVCLQRGVITENQEIYEFGFSLFISYCIECLLVIIFSIMIRKFYTSVIYIFLFSKLREYIGGYHANTYSGCILCYIFIYLLCLLFSEILDFKGLWLFTFIITFVLGKTAPIKHPNKNYTYVDIQRCRRYSFILCLILLIGSLGLNALYIKVGKFLLAVVIGVFILALLQSEINKKRKEANHETC